MSLDAVFADCVANPDDDGPRLVWADLVGGERGELVVIQCDLARGGLSVSEAAARRRRERELLERHSLAWAGDVAEVASRWSFRRGFVEAARCEAPARLPPLVSSATIGDSREPALSPSLRALDIVAYEVPWLRPMPNLRAFGLEYAHRVSFEALHQLLASAPIEALRLHDHRYDADHVRRLIDAAPGLRALDICGDLGVEVPLEAYLRPGLQALRLGQMRTLAPLAQLPRLERLGFGCANDAERDLFAGAEHLHSLEITGDVERASRLLAEATLPALRAVRFRGLVDDSVLHRIAARFQLEVLEISRYDELLHASADAMLDLGSPWLEMSLPALMVRLDGASREFNDIPPHPSDERIFLGRSSDVLVRVMSGSVARRHAVLTWSNGRHEIKDGGSTNGVRINGERIDRSPLHDGDEIALGDAILRYFVGPGAYQRALDVRRAR